ncbi:hypothetical protein PCANC_09730 [Puccinia coronata f. sp. avenae]|uniref:Uncharacterized protein n=1 Tax=Puccinia coronata f. sp. avenae TaxID=200324 RepID=A0A2N5V7I5_9BASI|nr:hypothetical protein PCANC_09730 [Puccinia coronata f. sp. avenae]
MLLGGVQTVIHTARNRAPVIGKTGRTKAFWLVGGEAFATRWPTSVQNTCRGLMDYGESGFIATKKHIIIHQIIIIHRGILIRQRQRRINSHPHQLRINIRQFQPSRLQGIFILMIKGMFILITKQALMQMDINQDILDSKLKTIGINLFHKANMFHLAHLE